MVTMATYIFCRLKGKSGNLQFFLSQSGYLEKIFFTEMIIELLFVFHIIFVQIAEFDWLPGRHKV